MSVLSALIRAGVPEAIARAEAPRAEKAMVERHITTQARARDFLAQVLHESGGLHYFEEIASGAAYEGRADLGNTHPGDGRRYKGRGPIQLTGRANYKAYGTKLHLPLEAEPTLAAKHDVGWRIAALYWDDHGLNQLADHGNFITITKRINGGTNGLASRLAYRQRLSHVDCRPTDPLHFLTPEERTLVAAFRKRRTAANKKKLVDQRKRIYVAGQKTGWNKNHRRQRYHILLEITR